MPPALGRKLALEWQRLEPFERFTRMVERHWNGIAAYCRRKDVALGSIEDLNTALLVKTASPRNGPGGWRG